MPEGHEHAYISAMHTLVQQKAYQLLIIKIIIYGI